MFRNLSRTLLTALALSSPAGILHAVAQTPPPAPASPPTYFEFGTVLSIGAHNIAIQAFDQQKQRPVQYTFILGSATKADPVQVGDTVEVIYTPTGADWTVRRLILLNTGVPVQGPPANEHRTVPTAVSTHLGTSQSAGRVPNTTAVAHSDTKNGGPNSATARNIALANARAGIGGKPPAPGSIDLGATTEDAKVPTAAADSIDLSADDTAKVATPQSTSLAGEAAVPKVMALKEVVREMPAEECNRSSEDWPTQPLRLAILDFRYPTEREESHAIGTTGGGSGTAVADLVYARLDELSQFAMIRGDRTKLYRADFAGAARVGREIGADAVLAGTFAPVDPPPGADSAGPKSYELRAGIVDTCTGQLLLRLASVQCPPGLDPNSLLNAASCTRRSVTAKQASDPKEQATAFKLALDALLDPLVHDGPPPGTQGSAGVVTNTTDSAITIKIASGATLKTGDQVALHAWRLTKNPTTYTLHNLHDEEIGRVTVTAVNGGTATGTFAGDFPPRPGDTAEIVIDAPAAVQGSPNP